MASWTDIGKSIAPLAPTLGGIIGGFIPIPGGSIVGQLAGKALATALGVPPTPEAVDNKLSQMAHDEKIAALKEATERARIEVDGFKEAEKQYYETLRTAIGETGLTMRTEILSENRHWFFTGWRPAAGWVFVFWGFVFGWFFMHALWRDPELLQRINDSWVTLAAYFGILAAMVGVYVVARSADKVAEKVAKK